MYDVLSSVGKKVLSKCLPNSNKVRFLSYLPKLEKFCKDNKGYKEFDHRFKLYEYVNDEVLKGQAVEYLEFGVFQGESLKFWAKMNSDQASEFHGFDTFTGLPEDWNHFIGGMKESTFDVEGQFPKIEDERVHFHKGLFQETLPPFLKERTSVDKQLVIHNDSDLYSSTLYVLTYANDVIKPGTVIIFDEFSTVIDEYRALEDYCSAYMRKFEVLGATHASNNYYNQVAIRIL